MARIPTGLHEVRITVAHVIELKPMPFANPRNPRQRPRAPVRVTSSREVPEVSAYPLIAPVRAEVSLDAAEDARRCLERVAGGLRLPSSGGSWRVRVPVLAR